MPMQLCYSCSTSLKRTQPSKAGLHAFFIHARQLKPYKQVVDPASTRPALFRVQLSCEGHGSSRILLTSPMAWRYG